MAECITIHRTVVGRWQRVRRCQRLGKHSAKRSGEWAALSVIDGVCLSEQLFKRFVGGQ